MSAGQEIFNVKTLLLPENAANNKNYSQVFPVFGTTHGELRSAQKCSNKSLSHALIE